MLQPASEPGLLHDVPGEEAVVEVDRGGIGAGRSQEAFEPPVGGMQAVGPVPVEKDNTAVFQQRSQRFGAVDADMALVGTVILLGQCPADFFREPARHADDQGSAGFYDAHDFLHGAVVVGNVLQDFAADDDIEDAVAERKRQGVRGGEGPGATAVDL